MGWIIALLVGLTVGYLIASRATTPDSVRIRRRTDSLRQGEVDSDRALSDAINASLAAVQVGIMVFGDDGQLIYRNPAAQFASFSRTTRALIDGEVRDLVKIVLRGAKYGSGTTRQLMETFEREIEIYGPPRAMLMARALPTGGREPAGVMVIVDDVTSERRLEEVRRSFVANVSHELRTPVGAIAVLAETLGTTTDPATAQRLADRLQKAAFRLGDMIEDLLELSRTESGAALQSEPLNVAEFVNLAVENLGESALSAGVEVVVSIEPDVISVTGDKAQLRSAVQNLLDNAIKYSEEGGEIHVDATTRGDWAVISVVDQGIGIPETDLDRIYERFYRVDSARRRETGGTGLGLSIVRHVVFNHGGDISAVSVEGEGTTFTIELPLVDASIGRAVTPDVGHPMVELSDQGAIALITGDSTEKGTTSD